MNPALTADSLNTALSGRYVIERELGSGGMATVYLAMDVRHQRRVAVKVLRAELAAVIGAERFLAEIKTTAHLQHPGILPLFDSGEAAGQLFYVMPFIDGESLRARLDRERQLPVADAVRIASEVAEALAYAHDHGVVHRDIKPENILLQSSRPIVADFGIALAVQAAGGNRLTQTGLSLGTPQYMSPEQAAGERTVDGRTDQYALGVVLYEMLVGAPPFTAPTTPALIAKLMSETAESPALQRRHIPDHVDAAILQSLEKLPADRFATTRDFARALAGDATTRVAPRPDVRRPAARQTIGLAVALGLGVVVGVALDRVTRRTSDAAPGAAVRFTVEPESAQKLTLVCCGDLFAIAPNGRRVAYQAIDPDSIIRLHVRELNDVMSRSIPGTEGARELFFSPDGERVGFATGRSVRFVDLRTSAVRVVAELPETGFTGGGAWTDGDRIVFAVGNRLLVAPAGGGPFSEMFRVDSAAGELQVGGPHFIRDANAIVYTIQTVGSEPRLHMRWLATGRTREIGVGVAPHYVEAGKWLLAARSDGTVEARRFNASTGDTLGPVRRVLSGVAMRSPVFLYAEYTVSLNGVIVTTSRAVDPVSFVGELRIVSAAGKEEVHQVPFKVTRLYAARFSPDGKRIASGAFDAQSRALTAFVYDPERRATTRLPGNDVSSFDWNTTGDSLLVATTGSTLYVQSAQGGEARTIAPLSRWANVTRMDARSPAGWVVFDGDREGSLDIGVLNRATRDTVRPLIATLAAEAGPRLSPDGRYIAFTVIENGRSSVQVASFPSLVDRILVSTTSGSEPKFSRDGTLFYLDGMRHVVVATLRSSGRLAVASQHTLGVVIPANRGWDVDPTGTQFVYGSEPRDVRPLRLAITVNALADTTDLLSRRIGVP
jgi:serine/threonine-protein kinase